MDAPLITLDDAANTTDVYAFVSQRFGQKYLTTALAVYPHEEPGVGPNKYNFDDDVLYEIRVATGSDVGKGRATYGYQFRFKTTFKNPNTILQSYLGVIANVTSRSRSSTATNRSSASMPRPAGVASEFSVPAVMPTLASSSRSPARATRCSTRVSSRSRTRTSTAARHPKWIVGCSISTP
jgi:hypothetical protein